MTGADLTDSDGFPIRPGATVIARNARFPTPCVVVEVLPSGRCKVQMNPDVVEAAMGEENLKDLPPHVGAARDQFNAMVSEAGAAGYSVAHVFEVTADNLTVLNDVELDLKAVAMYTGAQWDDDEDDDDQ